MPLSPTSARRRPLVLAAYTAAALLLALFVTLWVGKRLAPAWFLRGLTESEAIQMGMGVTHDCTTKAVLGDGDGAWTVCLDDGLLVDRMARGECIVYSFGINLNWSFDKTMARMGCEVFSFDPTTPWYFEDGKEVRDMAPNVHFHLWGLGPKDTEPEDDARRFKLRSISSLMREFGHARIDILKMDIEGSEWDVFPQLAESEQLMGKIGQLLTEVHFGWSNGTANSGHTNLFYTTQLKKLRDAGFELFSRVDNLPYGMYRTLTGGVEGRCCYDLGFLLGGSSIRI